MKYIKEMNCYQESQPTAVTLGKFDGLHRGHQKLIKKVREYAASGQVESVVCAFDMEPLNRRMFGKHEVIMTNEERRAFLEDQVDCLLECPFTETISSMSAEDFITDVLVGRLRAKYVVVGRDFRFGYGKKGDVHMLEQYADLCGYHLDVVEKEKYGKRVISSTYIKEELQKGNMELVGELLGYPYSLSGVVEHGRQLGREIGIPTMNILPPREKILPPNGVYMNRAVVDGAVYDGIVNIGRKPTVSEDERILAETYLFDYTDDAYGKEIKIMLYRHTRPETKFGSVEELKAQLEQDVVCGKQYFGEKR